jgi:hypothetical protein
VAPGEIAPVLPEPREQRTAELWATDEHGFTRIDWSCGCGLAPSVFHPC